MIRRIHWIPILFMMLGSILGRSYNWLRARSCKISPCKHLTHQLIRTSMQLSVEASESASTLSFTPPPLHYSELPDETIYLLDATSMLVTSHFSREVAAEYADATAKFQSRAGEELPCGALVGLAMVNNIFYTMKLISCMFSITYKLFSLSL